MNSYEQVIDNLKQSPKTWLVTGCAGFIGSHLLEMLLSAGQTVTGIDNFSTGHQKNLDEVRSIVGEERWQSFRFIQGDIRNLEDCRNACSGVSVVLHQAALGSVPRSIEDPITTNASNIDGFLNMLIAARDSGVKRFVYAASSSTYGDHTGLPKREDVIGKPLSPYAITKYVNELYADVFFRTYGLETIGLRYFNVFGQRQDPNGAYAAVIPRWFSTILRGEAVRINGDGETSRDFCYVANAVQANILAAYTTNPAAINQVYNVAFGERTDLNTLCRMIKQLVMAAFPDRKMLDPVYQDFRKGDVRHSLADIDKAKRLLGYAPRYSVEQGLKSCAVWYIRSENMALKAEGII